MQTKKKVLYVDDMETLRILVQVVLEDTEYSLVLFSNLPEAKKHFEDHSGSLALVISDGNINGTGDGYQWAKELRARGFKVMVFSSEDCEDVPYLSKNDFGKDFFSLVRKIEEILGE